jgi:hypothetical protein
MIFISLDMNWLTYYNQVGNTHYTISNTRFAQLCAESIASDYYVSVRTDTYPGSVSVTICPRQIYDTLHHLMDQTPSIAHLLPDWICGELEEATLESSKSVDETKTELLSRGFIMTPEFDQFIDHGDVDDDDDVDNGDARVHGSWSRAAKSKSLKDASPSPDNSDPDTPKNLAYFYDT